MRHARLRAPGPVFVFFEAAHAFIWALTFTLGMVFQVQVAHLDPFQLVIVGTVLEATCFVGEIPTGVVADLYSRKLSVLIGLVTISAGVAVTAVFPSFVPILIGNVIWGLGYTFTSGAAEAWFADELGSGDTQPWFTRATQWSLGANIGGIVTAGALGAADLRLPLAVGAVLFVALAAVLVVVMTEHGFISTPAAERETFTQMGRSLRVTADAARHRGVVRTFLAVSVLAGITSEVFDRLWTVRILDEFHLPSLFGLPADATWFTIFALISSAISLLASHIANRVATASLAHEHPARAMSILTAIQALSVLGFALSPWLWSAMGFRWARSAAAAVASPVRRSWLNRNVDPRTRATMLSAMSQADAIGQVIGGPAFGALAARAGITTALVASSLAQLPAAALLGRLRNHSHEDPNPRR